MYMYASYIYVRSRVVLHQAGEFGDCTGDAHVAYTFGCGGNLFATYTAVPSAADGSDEDGVALWWTALGFAAGKGPAPGGVTLLEVRNGVSPTNGLPSQTSVTTTTCALLEADLAPMADAAPRSAFGDVPTGAFEGAALAFGAGSAYVRWAPDFVNQDGCAGVEVAAWNGSVALGFPQVGGGGGGGGDARVGGWWWSCADELCGRRRRLEVTEGGGGGGRVCADERGERRAPNDTSHPPR